MNEILKILGEIFGYAISAAVLYMLYYVKIRMKNKHADTIKKSDVQVYRSIYEQMTILLSSGGDRVYIMEFHNGVDFSSSILQWKLSCTYEIARNGISRMQDRLQDMKASRLSSYIGIFYADKDEALLHGVTRAKVCRLCTSCNFHCAFEFDVDTMGETHLVAELEIQGIFGMYQVGIRNSKDELIGILGIDYCKPEHWKAVKQSDSDIPHQLKETAMRIARIWEVNND